MCLPFMRNPFDLYSFTHDTCYHYNTCFVFTTFPSLRHLVSWEQDIMIYIVSRRNDRIRKAASRGMPLCGAWPKLTMKWPLIKGQARPDPETHKWRKLLWPLLPPPLYQINQFGLSAVHPFDACYQKLKYAYVLHYIYSKAQQFGEAEIIISGHPYKHRKAKWTALP